MQIRQNLVPLAMTVSGASALIASSYITASNGHTGVLISFLSGCLLTCMVVVGATRVRASEVKFERQLRELEMEAHKFGISSSDLDTQVLESAVYSRREKLLKKILRAESRSEKLSFILVDVGFSSAHRFIRDLRENRAPKAA